MNPLPHHAFFSNLLGDVSPFLPFWSAVREQCIPACSVSGGAFCCSVEWRFRKPEVAREAAIGPAEATRPEKRDPFAST
jgi:hypothetical protein